MSLGATGDFPRGKFSADDEGALRLAISHKDRTVIIDFGTPTKWIGLDADTALAFAEAVAHHAKECKKP